MAEAVNLLFKVKGGRLENLLPRERTALAGRIHFAATGSKREPCYLVVDSGEGPTPASFENTFLSLTKRNKDDIPFVQGRFNCGGTRVLPFCGEHKYQLIVSRRHPSCAVDKDDTTKDQMGIYSCAAAESCTWSKVLYVRLSCTRGFVSVDCTEMVPAAREDFLMASRDRVRRNEVYDAIYSTLRDDLNVHSGLREHNALRRKRRLDETLSKDENGADLLAGAAEERPHPGDSQAHMATPIDLDREHFD